jgi:hypothetical protein
MERASRVRDVRLTVGIDESDASEASAIRRLAEGPFLQGLLDACDRTVHGELGADALIFVRHVDLRLRLERRELDSPQVLEELGRELGMSLIASAASVSKHERLRPRRDAKIVIFEEEAHLRAAYLAADADGEAGAWFFASLRDEPDVWTATVEAGPELLREVLGWLGAMDAAAAVLARLGEAAAERTVALLPLARWPITPPPAAVAAAARTDARRRGAAPIPPGQPDLAPTPSPSRDRAEPVEPAPVGEPDTVTAAARAEPETASPAVETGGAPLGPDVEAPRAGGLGAAAPAAGPAGTEAQPERGAVPAAPTAAASATPTAAPAVTDAVTADKEIETAFGGLFYLAGRVLEVELAEHLYFAGILEGRFLTHVARLLIADAGDPAPRLLGGAPDPDEDPPLAPVAAWAADEVWEKGRRSLADWLRRRSLPCPLDDELVEALDRVAAPLAAPARVAAADPTTATLLARAAAIVTFAFGARLGRASLRLNELRGYLGIPGRVAIDERAMRVILPMAAVDVQLRLAGIDFSPGWIPWLRRPLIIDFVGDGLDDGGGDGA